MRKTGFILGIIFIISSFSCTKTETADLAITNVTIIDVTGAPARSEMTVLVRDNLISSVSRTEKMQIPKDAKVIDASGKYLIPGLWDMHVHSSYTGWFAKEDTWFIENNEINKEIFFPLCIANGVLGIRDLGGDLQALKRWRQEVEQKKLIGPRIIATGPIIDGPKPSFPLGSIAIGSAIEGRRVVNSLLQEGADFIKVRELIPRDAYFAIADECKRLGIPLAGHVPKSVNAYEASDAGQKCIEHFTSSWLLSLCQPEELEKGPKSFDRLLHIYSEEKAKSVFKKFVGNGTWLCPTLVLDHRLSHLDEIDQSNHPGLKYIPEYWIDNNWKPYLHRKLSNYSSEDAAYSKKAFNKQLKLTDIMNRSGVQLLAGTDTIGIYLVPGFSLHEELALLVKAGLTPMEALKTATINPAKYLGLQDSLGTIGENKIADLVLLDANPLENISNTQKINAVIINGKFFSRADLDIMLAQALIKLPNKEITTGYGVHWPEKAHDLSYYMQRAKKVGFNLVTRKEKDRWFSLI
ncbi:MAG: amidohydrolase family protein [Candidatus Hodarchaeota archaeon]